jgi:hypothetical protein
LFEAPARDGRLRAPAAAGVAEKIDKHLVRSVTPPGERALAKGADYNRFAGFPTHFLD